MQSNHNLPIIANDKFKPLYDFWISCKLNKVKLCEELYKSVGMIEKDDFMKMRAQIMNEPDNFNASIMFFIINRCSFSGATLSGGFSLDASKTRFTRSCVDRVLQLDFTDVELYNIDYEEFIIEHSNREGEFLFLDPPYYLKNKSKLYGNNGDMHEHFDHNKLHECLSKTKGWLLTYNNCPFITDLYKDYKIIETSWSYGMNKSKISSEIVIIG